MTLQHVALETRPGDAEAEVRFWALLGFARVEPPPGLAERAVWMTSQPPRATQIHLLFADAPVVPSQGHVAVVAPAPYVEVVDALSAAGFEVAERARHWGQPRCYVTSPGGHRVEVMAAPPA